jgi:hypothetical protein
MPPFPSSYRSKSSGVDDNFPFTLSTAATGGISSPTGDAASTISAVFSVSINLVDSGRKRKSREDVDGVWAQKKAWKECSDKGSMCRSSNHDDGPEGSGNAANSTAPTKQHNKRSDAGRRRQQHGG